MQVIRKTKIEKVLKISSKFVVCIKSESEDYLEEDLNKEIKNKSNVLDIQIFPRETYWVAFIIYKREHA